MASGEREYFTLDDFKLQGSTVFLRLDVNSPINPVTGEIIGTTRFHSHLDTIRRLSDSKVVIIAHQSRPGKEDFTSLREHARIFESLLDRNVDFVDSLFGDHVTSKVKKMRSGEIMMLENTRFYSEEVNIDGKDLAAMEQSNLVRRLLPLMNYFVNDAFPAIHRPQTTLVGFQRLVPNIAGELINREISSLSKFMEGDMRPKIAILAGAKINESISVASNFLKSGSVDRILTGGVVANAFLWAKGIEIGKRNQEFIVKNNKNYRELIDVCRDLITRYPESVMLPTDAVLYPSKQRLIIGESMPDDQVMADIGVDTIVEYIDTISRAQAIFMNGPMGMYEFEDFSLGTFEIVRAIARNKGLKIAGGGHTLSVLEHLNLMSKISHASTGGGALISYLSGEEMPVLEALKASKKFFAGKYHGGRE